MRENALELHGVCKKYGGFALRNVGFTLPRGTDRKSTRLNSSHSTSSRMPSSA